MVMCVQHPHPTHSQEEEKRKSFFFSSQILLNHRQLVYRTCFNSIPVCVATFLEENILRRGLKKKKHQQAKLNRFWSTHSCSRSRRRLHSSRRWKSHFVDKPFVDRSAQEPTEETQSGFEGNHVGFLLKKSQESSNAAKSFHHLPVCVSQHSKATPQLSQLQD